MGQCSNSTDDFIESHVTTVISVTPTAESVLELLQNFCQPTDSHKFMGIVQIRYYVVLQ